MGSSLCSRKKVIPRQKGENGFSSVLDIRNLREAWPRNTDVPSQNAVAVPQLKQATHPVSSGFWFIAVAPFVPVLRKDSKHIVSV